MASKGMLSTLDLSKLLVFRKCTNSVHVFMGCSQWFNDSRVRHCSHSAADDTDDDVSLERLQNVSNLPNHIRARMAHVKEAPDNVNRMYPLLPLKLHLRRKRFAKYGAESGIDPGVMWPSLEDLGEKLEFEKQFEPSLDEMWKNINEEKSEKELRLRKKEQHVEEQMAKMPEYIQKFRDKLHKDDEQEKAAETRRQASLDEAREFFGFKIDTKDPRFHQLMDLKSEKEKKDRKIKKKEHKDTILLDKLKGMVKEEK